VNDDYARELDRVLRYAMAHDHELQPFLDQHHSGDSNAGRVLAASMSVTPTPGSSGWCDMPDPEYAGELDSALSRRQSYDTSHVLLPSAGGRAGPEKVKSLPGDVSLYSDPFGSHRLVYAPDGVPVAGIQVVSRGPGSGHVTAAFTHVDHRRKGYARRLIELARSLFPQLTFDHDRSLDGAALVAAVSAKK
jgi:ribosomal protein S18 acetylase RimI-like enzyme